MDGDSVEGAGSVRVAWFGRWRLAAAVAVLAVVIVLMLLPVVVVIVAVTDGAEITGVIALASVTTLVVKVAQRPAAMRPVVDG